MSFVLIDQYHYDNVDMRFEAIFLYDPLTNNTREFCLTG